VYSLEKWNGGWESNPHRPVILNLFRRQVEYRRSTGPAPGNRIPSHDFKRVGCSHHTHAGKLGPSPRSCPESIQFKRLVCV
jgi:hypothetical protein